MLMEAGKLKTIVSMRFETVVLSNNPESIYGNEGVFVFINLA